MRINILLGGKAGQGANLLTQLVGNALVKKGYCIFYSRNYESLIRGGHNFNVLTFSNEEIYSNDSKINILVCLDEKTEQYHKKDLIKGGMIIKDEGKNNAYIAGKISKILNINFKLLEEQLKKLKNFNENLANAQEGYKNEKRSFNIKQKAKSAKEKEFINGAQGIASGAIDSGLDLYYAYPMTPATSVLFELAPLQEKNNFLVLELENEISVINAAIGSAITGAKCMIGTSGGGFDLMTEALSMAGQAEVPIVCYLASRPGPSTGVPTATSQGDLQLARNAGHGEFFRFVLAPGDPKECKEITNQAFYFSQNYKAPVIVLSDKHLAESAYSLDKFKEKIISVKKSTNFGRYNSYEHADNGKVTEDPSIIKKNCEKRLEKIKKIEKEVENFPMYKIFGKKNSKNLVISWGSTKGAILDAIKGLDVKFVQILYIEPFPKKIVKELMKAKKVFIVENSSTGQISKIIREKTGILIEDHILKYDGMPFLCDELQKEIKKRIGGN